MEQLLAQVPELQKKLKHKVDTRTIHYKDVQEQQFLPVDKRDNTLFEGKVIKIDTWVDDTGYQWTRADVMLYIKMHELFANDKLKAMQTQVKETEASYVY